LINRALRYKNQGLPAKLMAQVGRAGGPPLTKLGSNYGGWLTPLAQLNEQSIVYSLGVGLDVSFDEALIQQTDCTIVACDPTPHSVEFIAEKHAKGELPREKFIYHPVAIWGEDTTLKLYEPKTRGWVGSYSAMNLQGTNRFIEVPARKLSSVVKEHGHAQIDLLKIDIEGAEHFVIPEILNSGVPIGWICLEIDQPIPPATTRALVDIILNAGYTLRAVELWNFTFQSTRHS
jgi:FkbM family methyltransferase